MTIQIILVDINANMVQAWEETFEAHPEVIIQNGSMLDQTADAWVSPTNSKGNMDGGLDAVIKKHLGNTIETRVQSEILSRYNGTMPVGHATCVETGAANPKFLISTPTMTASSQDISDSLNVALACAAAFQAVHMQNDKSPGSIASVAMPGLGANTGKVPVEICADLMWTGYNLFLEHKFADFLDMRAALEEQLGSLGPSTPTQHHPASGTQPTPQPLSQPKPPTHKTEDLDFDDFE